MDWRELFQMYCDKLRVESSKDAFLWSDGDEILCLDDRVIDALADILDRNGGTGNFVTGFYAPIEDIRDDCVDSHTGYYYLALQ